MNKIELEITFLKNLIMVDLDKQGQGQGRAVFYRHPDTHERKGTDQTGNVDFYRISPIFQGEKNQQEKQQFQDCRNHM